MVVQLVVAPETYPCFFPYLVSRGHFLPSTGVGGFAFPCPSEPVFNPDGPKAQKASQSGGKSTGHGIKTPRARPLLHYHFAL